MLCNWLNFNETVDVLILTGLHTKATKGAYLICINKVVRKHTDVIIGDLLYISTRNV